MLRVAARRLSAIGGVGFKPAPPMAQQCRWALQSVRFMSSGGNIRFTNEHEYVKVDGKTATIGITDYAQGQLGDVVYVELPEVGQPLAKEDTFGSVESVKAASDLYSPVSGDVVKVNEALSDDPGLINTAAMGDGWIVQIEMSDQAELDDLMDEAAYKEFCDSLE